MSDSPQPPAAGTRRLHGVLVADMTGFSRLMGEDEAQAVAALTRIRDVFKAVVPRHGGSLDVAVGDCLVALFDSAAEAVHAAIAIQTDLAETPGPDGAAVRIRIGIHVGDVMRSGDEIFGDSVNIAARLQAIARPGGVAVSEEVYRGVRNRVSVPFRDLGAKAMKNIREKIHVYEFNVDDAAATKVSSRLPSLRAAALTAAGITLIAGLAWLGYRPETRPARFDAPGGTTGLRQVAAAASREDDALSVGVTGVSALGDVPGWMRDSTRDGFNTLFSKVAGLRVFSREKIDFLRQRRGMSEIEVAEALGIQKMISGSLATDGNIVVIEARVVDTSTGILDASESARGSADDLIELQNQVASDVLVALGVRLSTDDRAQLFARRTRETLDAYRRMAETFGEAPDDAIGAPAPDERRSWLSWPRAALAESPATSETAILAVLEAYRDALERKDVDAVAATHIEMTADQRRSFERYFESAEELTVAVSDVDVLIVDDEALVTFTRRDSLRDRKSGKDVELEVRLSSEVVATSGAWLLRGVKRSSD